MKTNYKVLIIGHDMHNALGLMESLGLKGVKPDVIVLMPHGGQSILQRSKNHNRFWICRDEDEIIKCMINNFPKSDEKTLVLTAADIISVYLDNHYEELKDLFYLPLPTFHGELERMMSKQYMHELAIKTGITVPRTWLTDDNTLPADVEYPCITKGINSTQGSKEDLYICKDQSDLKAFLGNGQHCDTIQIQTYIDKEYEFQLMGCSLDNGNEVIITGRTTIDRPNGIDNTFFLSFDKIEPEKKELIEKAKQYIKATTYNGPFSMEFLHGKDGKDYFMELNFRNDGNAYCQTAAGINTPYIIYLYYFGGDYKAEIAKSVIKKTTWMPGFAYFLFLRQGEFGLGEFLRNMWKADSYSYYYSFDKRVFWYKLYNYTIYRIIKKLHLAK